MDGFTLNYYSFHIGDYRRDTTHLSMLEHGAYRQLLDWLYLEEKPIPLDMEIVFRKLRATTEEEQKAIITVLNEFFLKNKKGFSKNKCISQINNYKKRCEHNKKVGKLGGRPVSEITQTKPTGLLKKTQIVSKNNPNHKPITNNHKPIYNSSFSIFWNLYPKKVGKKQCQDIFKRLNPPIDKIKDALKWQTDSDQWQKGFIPNPATYLNQGRWEDEPDSKINGDTKVLWYNSEEATLSKGREIGLKRDEGESLGHYRHRIQERLVHLTVRH